MKSRYEKFIWDTIYNETQVTIMEIGAGVDYQAIRNAAEKLLDRFGEKQAKLVRINPSETFPSIFGYH
jgi:hypothetical protein